MKKSLYTGDRAELLQTKAGTWLLKHHMEGGCTLLRFFRTMEEADATLSYLTSNGVLPPYPDDSANEH